MSVKERITLDEARMVAAVVASHLTGRKGFDGYSILGKFSSIISVITEELGGLTFKFSGSVHANRVRILRTTNPGLYDMEFLNGAPPQAVGTLPGVPLTALHAAFRDYTGLDLQAPERASEDMTETARQALQWLNNLADNEYHERDWMNEFTAEFAIDFLGTEAADPLALNTELVLSDGSHLQYAPPVGWSCRGIWKG